MSKQQKKYYSPRERWLNQHGGRIESDVLKDKDGEYIVLSAKKHKIKKLYIPIFDLSTDTCG